VSSRLSAGSSFQIDSPIYFTVRIVGLGHVANFDFGIFVWIILRRYQHPDCAASGCRKMNHVIICKVTRGSSLSLIKVLSRHLQFYSFKHYAINTYGGGGITPPFLTSALDEGE
jgi:hypothetical protein